MKKHLFIILLICINQLNAQIKPPLRNDFYYNNLGDYYGFLKIKTYTLLPPPIANHVVKNVVVFKPFVEYRYYKSYIVGKNLCDSAFVCSKAEVDSNYVHFPFRQKIAQGFFNRQCSRKLKRLCDTTTIFLAGDTARFIKNELDSIMLLAKNVGINTYTISDKLFTCL